jgi:hypothetical protein
MQPTDPPRPGHTRDPAVEDQGRGQLHHHQHEHPVASQALAAVPLEKPARLIAENVGSCVRPYTPSPTDTSDPAATASSVTHNR